MQNNNLDVDIFPSNLSAIKTQQEQITNGQMLDVSLYSPLLCWVCLEISSSNKYALV